MAGSRASPVRWTTCARKGLLGRHFARQNAGLLQVVENPLDWSEDDVLYALLVLGADQPGNTIL